MAITRVEAQISYTFKTLAGSAGSPGSADGSGSTARFNSPKGIAIDGAGNLYIADSGNSTVRKITPAGVVSTLAGSPGITGSADGVGASARFNLPIGIAVDGSGNVLVCDTANNAIRKISADGVVSTFAGKAGPGGYADGVGTAASFLRPLGIALDGSGFIYVVDNANGEIRRITPGGSVTTLVGGGAASEINGPLASAQFAYPTGIAFDSLTGNLYIGDDYAVRKMTPAGIVTTLAGGITINGSADGIGTAAGFRLPYGLATDSAGNIFVADEGGNTIRRVTPDGIVSTVGGSIAGSSDGTASGALFFEPSGVATDPSGNIYVADTGNHTVRVGVPTSQLAFLGPATATGTVGQAFSYQIVTSIVPTGYLVTNLPAGLSMNSANGIIAGIPIAAGTFNVGIGANTATGNANSSVSVTIAPAAASITLNGLSATADGMPKIVTATTIPANLNYSVTYNGSTSPPSALGSYAVVGTITSAYYTGSVTGTLVISSSQPPTISVQPVSHPMVKNASDSFGVLATGTLPFTYQWYFNGSPITGATGSVYEITQVQDANAGNYTVTVSNPFGSVTSLPAVATVVTSLAGQPVIEQQPANVTSAPGAAASFSVLAYSNQPGSAPTYQWNFNGLPVAGANGDSYTIANVQPADAGNYTVTVSTPVGATTSAAANLAVVAPGAPAIVTQPKSDYIYAGQSETISVVGTGTAPLSYQWYFAGTPIAGATSPTYTIGSSVAANSGQYTVIISNGAGYVVSNAANLAVGPALAPFPEVTSSPQSVSANLGADATFWVAVGAGGPFSYQWYFNGGTLIAGATGPVLTIKTVTAVSAGLYNVAVTNAGGTIFSAQANLVVNPANSLLLAPTITMQPLSVTIASGNTAVISAQAANATTYQWFLNGVPIPGGGQPQLVISNSTVANAGGYTCVAFGAGGSVTSSVAALSVVNTANPGRLIDLSCRAQVGTGGQILITGFVTGGQGTSGSQSLLVRASGPALAPFGIEGYLSDPILALSGTGGVVASNGSWGGNPSIAAVAASVGAFPWSSPLSHDAAVLASLQPGAYSASVSGASNDTGIALAEVYDATPNGSFQPNSPRLINLSARVQVGAGSSALIAGFVIGGSTAKSVLLRASGPALLPFGVTGVLQDPVLTLASGATTVATNNGWAGNSQISGIAAAVGAFPWSNPLSGDSALLVTLSPGAYTATVSGFYGDGGIALVEIYEVP